jgi:hypothetical protein
MGTPRDVDRKETGVIFSGEGAIGLFPEGIGTGHLIEPMPGVASFLLSLSNRGIPVLPVGIFEEGGRLIASFGPPFSIQVQRSVEKGERERLASQQVMVATGRLLPPQLWGVHAPFVEEALAQERAGRWVAARQRECLLKPEEDRG